MKIQMPFESALRGIGGQFEITRVLGGFGALAYCVCVNTFVGWEVLIAGKDFERGAVGAELVVADFNVAEFELGVRRDGEAQRECKSGQRAHRALP